MMQMLEAGGLPAKTDGERVPDHDNPRGYLEWEAIQQIGKRPEIFDEPGLEKLAVKCVTAHLGRLPRWNRYRLIMMRRPVEEITRSQAKMISNRGGEGMSGNAEDIAEALFQHFNQVLAHLERFPRAFEILLVDYPSLVAEPEAWISKIAEFLGPELLPHPDRMAAAIDPKLYRNRA
jgi:hypothetical protein